MVNRKLKKATLSRQINIGARRSNMGNNKLSMSLLAGVLGSGVVQSIMNTEDNEITSCIKSGALCIAATETLLSIGDLIRRCKSINKIANLIIALQNEGINIRFGSLEDTVIYNVCLEGINYEINVLELDNAVIKEKISDEGISYQYIDCDEEDKEINITDVVNENILSKKQKKSFYYK